MQDMQDMIERLNHSGRKLSKGHRRIAQYIVEHYDKAVFMTASRLGESVGVSESTVVRFAAVLGYEGYPQLQRALQELVSHRLTAVQRFEMSSEIDPNAVLRTVLKSDMQNIRATVEELDNHAFEEGVKRILNAKEIYVIGLRSAAPLAQFLGYYLNYIFDRCTWFPARPRMCLKKSPASARRTWSSASVSPAIPPARWRPCALPAPAGRR